MGSQGGFPWDPRGRPMGSQGVDPWGPRVGAHGIPEWEPVGSQGVALGDLDPWGLGPLWTHWPLGARALGARAHGPRDKVL
mgnify:CR=1 FL=1